MDRQQTRTILQRKKLWQIDECFKCAVIGSCLTRGEMRQLNRDNIFSFGQDTDDYQLHSHFIRVSRQQDLAGKTLHRFLEKKYRAKTSKYFRVETDAEIEKLWQEDLADGRPDIAWWAVITHPRATTDLVNRLYGQLHMLSHECIGTYSKKKTMVADLKSRVMVLEEVLSAERQSYLRERGRFQEEITTLEMEIDSQAILLSENAYLRKEVVLLGERIGELTSGGVHGIGYDSKVKIDELTAELEQMRREQTEATKAIADMEGRLSQLLQEKNDLAGKSAALQALLRQNTDKGEPCATCAEQHTENCPGLDLCGKTVLYVGGLNKMVPHYRQLVEDYGGRFVHHDGGKESSRNLLPRMLVTADAVLCPVDCVSHDACNCVKKICKRYQKPFVLMRSASLSCLAKGLSNIQ